MNCLRVNSIDQYEAELMGYNLIGNKIIYLTQTQLCTIRVGNKLKKQSIKIKGTSILNFVISKRGYIAFLLKNKTIQVRRMDSLSQILHKFTNIITYPEQNYPKMKWDYDQLYLIYSDSIQILDIKTKKRKGFTDIIVGYQNEQINDVVIANVMDQQKAAIIQLNNMLIFTIIPIPITEAQIPSINAVLTIYSPSFQNDSRRQYIAILNSNRFLRIMNMLNLKQICQVDLQPKNNQFLQMQVDANNQCILIRYISSVSMEITRNVIYKINSQAYYSQNQDYFTDKPSPFFRYKFQINITENLTLFPLTFELYEDEVFDYYSLIFFKKGHIYSAVQLIPHSYSQSTTLLKYKVPSLSYQITQWKDIIQTYFQLSNRRDKDGLFQQERQLNQYNIIKDQFDSIIAKFTKRINQENKKNPLTQNKIQEQWDQYMAQIAKQRNFMLQTMKLFKIQPQIIRKNTSPPQPVQVPVSSQLQICMNDIENRQKRIDARIKQKKKEIELQKAEKPKVTREEIQKYQNEYQKFVAQFMQETQRKQKEEKQKQKQKSISHQIDQKFILALPNLSEQQRKLINIYSHDIEFPIHNKSIQQPLQLTKAQEQKDQRKRMQQLLQSIEEKINPIILQLQPLIDRLSNIQVMGLQRIKKNQQQVNKRCSLNLQQVVKNGCKRMLLTLSTRIKKQIQSTTRQIYQLQDKNRQYYEQSLQKFKQYIKYQIMNRIQIFYKSRRRLQMKLIEMSKDIPNSLTQQKPK